MNITPRLLFLLRHPLRHASYPRRPRWMRRKK